MSRPCFVDMISSANRFISCPVDVAWQHLLNQAAWMRDFVVQSISGDFNREGEVKRLMPLPANTEGLKLEEVRPFFFKTLLIVPYRKLVYKAYTENRDGEYGFTGVEILTLKDVSRGTAVIFEGYLEFQSSTMNEAELKKFVGQVRDGGQAVWDRNLQRLEELAQTRHQ